MEGMKSVFFFVFFFLAGGGGGGGEGRGLVRLMASENFMTIYHCSVCIRVIFGKK